MEKKTISLKQLCRDLNLEPRATRIKLRKLMPHKHKQRWAWDEDEVKSIRELLNEQQPKTTNK